MSSITIEPDRFLTESTQSLLERTLIAEFLLSKGYLISELKELPHQLANTLMREACQFASLRLAEIESRDKFQQKIRMRISRN